MTFNKKVIYVLIAMLVLFCGLVLYFSYFQIFKSADLVNAGTNPRTYIKEQSIKRGSIYDRNGETLAYSNFSDGTQTRVYPFNRLYSQLIGYSHPRFGRTLLEDSQNGFLLGGGVKAGVLDAVFGASQTAGADITLTVDNKLQLLAADLLGNRNGAITAVNPNTGEVLAMVSKPWFNPNTLTENWEALNQTEGMFVPRATAGLYPPGSAFKVITAAAAAENMLDGEVYEDTGSLMIDGQEIVNYNKKVYGELDMDTAFAKSSNTYFAHIADMLGAEKLKETAESFYFNKEIPFDIPLSESTLLKRKDRNNVAAVGYGQGDTLTTPLHMALIAATVANDGVMMQPYVVREAKTESNETVYSATPKILTRSISPAAAARVTEMMCACVSEGTGTGARISGITVAGKTGTAEVGGNKADHAWFIAFAPAQNPQIAVSVVLENEGTTGATCAGLAGNLIRAFLQ